MSDETLFYDSTTPSLIPDDAAAAALYYDGDYNAVSVLNRRFKQIRWITVTGNAAHAGIADYETGNAVFAGTGRLRSWVQARNDMGKRARVYCNRITLQDVVEQLEGLDWLLWLATLDGDKLSPSYARNLWAVQFDGGPHADYDTSILYGDW